jgi:hypothetical protein
MSRDVYKGVCNKVNQYKNNKIIKVWSRNVHSDDE